MHIAGGGGHKWKLYKHKKYKIQIQNTKFHSELASSRKGSVNVQNTLPSPGLSLFKKMQPSSHRSFCSQFQYG